MPSVISSLIKAQIGLLNPLFNALDLEKQRRLQDSLAALGSRVAANKTGSREVELQHCGASWVFQLSGKVSKAALYLHGGGYTSGTLDYARGFGSLLALETGRALLCLGYRLAPEHPFPAALDDAVEAYRLMLERYRPEEIALIGESAGGGLCFSLALKLKQLGLPQPERIVAISPWTDVAMTRDVSDLQKLDILIHRDNVKESARMYVGCNDPRDPLISPLYGDHTGLPPSLIFVGSHEILLDDSVLMHEKLEQSGCTCELHIAEGMWHVYVLYGVPEAREALKRIALYLTGEKHRG